jgi:hypothetical protein
VPLRDAGSASGLLSTAQQLGGAIAIGVAVIGVVFFGLLSSQTPASADAVTPRIRNGLTAAGCPHPSSSRWWPDFAPASSTGPPPRTRP